MSCGESLPATRPLTAAAASLLVVGLVATVVLVVDRPATAPGSEPEATAAPGTSASNTPANSTPASATPTTALPVPTIELVVEAGRTTEEIGERVAALIDRVDPADFVAAAEPGTE